MLQNQYGSVPESTPMLQPPLSLHHGPPRPKNPSKRSQPSAVPSSTVADTDFCMSQGVLLLTLPRVKGNYDVSLIMFSWSSRPSPGRVRTCQDVSRRASPAVSTRRWISAPRASTNYSASDMFMTSHAFYLLPVSLCSCLRNTSHFLPRYFVSSKPNKGYYTG